MVFETFSPAVNVMFSYQAYVGLSMKADNTESGLSGIAPYGFYHLNSSQASNFLGVCQQCLTFDLSSNQRIIIEKCMEECKKVINENSVKYWKSKWFEENQRASEIENSFSVIQQELKELKGQLKKAQNKIVSLKRR